MNEQRVVNQTRAWLRDFVIGYNLCPFAASPFRQNKIRFRVVEPGEGSYYADILAEEMRLLKSPSENWETTLLIFPEQWLDFMRYLSFAEAMDQCVDDQGWRGDIQLATFHPDYQFGGEDPKGASHYTNRSPYPMLHLIREDHMEAAIHNHPDTARIPEVNKEQMEKLGVPALEQQLENIKRLD